MGGRSYIVIGPDAEEQMARFRSFDGYVDKHVRSLDILQETLEDFAAYQSGASASTSLSFENYVSERRSLGRILKPGETPDLLGKDRFGWVRVDDAGKVSEIFHRDRPNSFWVNWGVLVTSWKLKPGIAATSSIASERISGTSTPGYTGSALKGEIDWQKMRSDIAMEAGEYWDLSTAGMPLPVHTTLRYTKPPQHNVLQYPREKFVQINVDMLINRSALIINGKIIDDQDFNGWENITSKNEAWYRYLNELIDSLPDDTLMTDVYTRD
ncbi:hypothetical protein [Undibacterium pigrum]|uniref:Uncharacterized protein n=1 Tax=Undibacterium pigrum TaxID=401470 RepID=A0A318ILZ8_9BURK|nr:hypothetical protein [Undibacterium pigrum]PXX35306.1 hypothetical protein DFR42_12141 [Undibacterium pigrum]